MAKPLATNCTRCSWYKGGRCLYWHEGVPGKGSEIPDLIARLGRGFICPDPRR